MPSRIGQRLRGGRPGQAARSLAAVSGRRFGKRAGVGGGRHEVGVARSSAARRARGGAGARCRRPVAEVEPDVDPSGSHRGLHRPHGVGDRRPQLGRAPSAVRSSRSATSRYGSTSMWPTLYGKAFRIDERRAPRCTMWVSSSGSPDSQDAGEHAAPVVVVRRRPTAPAGLDVGGPPPVPQLFERGSSDRLAGRRRPLATSSPQPLDEVVDADVALDLAAARVDAERAVGDVVVADDEHVRELLELGGADALAELIVGLDRCRPGSPAARRRRPTDVGA